MTQHNLKSLLKDIDTLSVLSPSDITTESVAISTLTADSRKVESACIFVAVKGVNADGHAFISKAVDKGATVIVCEKLPDNHTHKNVIWVQVKDSSIALGQLASAYYGHPSRHLRLVGVTGTNGKTTIATLLYNMARMHNERAGLLSTVVNKIEDEEIPSTHTTPDPIALNALLARMVEKGCTFAAMEVSSHAAAQHRIAGLHFAGGIFTNLTRDHLDYHKTFDAYIAAKKSFFDNLPTTAFAITNADDRNGNIMLQNTPCKDKSAYSVRTDADFRIRVVEDRIDGMLLNFNGKEVETMFVGRFNASNLAAVYAAATKLGYDNEETLLNISRLRPVAGRFQPFRSAQNITAIVDYAHTPDALVNVLNTIHEIVPDTASIITVCGCGGNRDKGKRPIMAAEAAKLSTKVILTSDNPRNEKPEEIIREMEAGLNDEQHSRTLSITDRRQAIRTAAAITRPGDIILIAGKGHETYQIIGDETLHFDDREEICAALNIPYQTNTKN